MSSMPNGKDAAPTEIDPKLVRDLAKILRDTELSEIEVESSGLRIRVARSGPTYVAAPAPMTIQAAPVAAPAPSAAPASTAPAAAPAPVADLRSHPGVVTSPMVGTAYLQPEPGAAAFVKIGDMVSEGQTLLIVEAMKTMNPIPAPRAGKVEQILIGDSQPVEFGEPLFILA
jgi:acetyl-CoA carboxylase biotin carboxyl carrier protein